MSDRFFQFHGLVGFNSAFKKVNLNLSDKWLSTYTDQILNWVVVEENSAH